MKKLLKYLGNICLIIGIIFITVYVCNRHYENIYIDCNNKYQLTMFNADYYVNRNAYVMVPRIDNKSPNTDNEEFIVKCNKNLHKVFYDWMPQEYLAVFNTNSMTVKMFSDEYLSIETCRAVDPDKSNWEDEYCNTLDLNTGEIIYLDDIIYINDEFINMLKSNQYIKTDNRVSERLPIENYTFEQEYLDELDFDFLKEKIDECSEPYNKDNYSGKATFYLKHNRLYLVNIFGSSYLMYKDCSEFYIELDDIEDFLKVEKW